MKMKNRKENGFTLVETLIVIVVFAIATLAIGSVEFYGQKLYAQQEDLAEITQNGRVVMERLTRELRQAKNISSVLPATETGAPSEITFQDGHVNSIYATSTPQNVSTTAITLEAASSAVDDFYRDTFIEITSGWGNTDNKIRKITGYDGTTKIATVDQPWADPSPTTASVYKIDSGYYYIGYFASSTEIYRKVEAYYFPSDPDNYLPYNATSTTETLTAKILEQPEIVGEFFQNLKFWGGKLISIKINLTKNGQVLELQNKIFGRNL